VVTICTASLTFNNSTFCPHSVFVCFVWIWEQTAIISLYNIIWLIFITDTECVYCAVRAECSYIIEIILCLYVVHPPAVQMPLPRPAGQSTHVTHLSPLSYTNINSQHDKWPRSNDGETCEGNKITVLWCESVHLGIWVETYRGILLPPILRVQSKPFVEKNVPRMWRTWPAVRGKWLGRAIERHSRRKVGWRTKII
jgi:hypothetical protein